jgi:DNA-binding FadR family transcriptional regulator
MEQAMHQHMKVLDAIRHRNPVRAREAMRSHLQSFQRGYKVLFEQELLNEKG